MQEEVKNEIVKNNAKPIEAPIINQKDKRQEESSNPVVKVQDIKLEESKTSEKPVEELKSAWEMPKPKETSEEMKEV